MTGSKDLVEAQAYRRRRLVHAFVSGSTEGHDGDSSRPGRTAVAGLALAGLMVAGAAVAGQVAPLEPQGWAERDGLVISATDQTPYVLTEDGAQVHPVYNLTSAKLILGEDADEPVTVEGDAIEKLNPGPYRGIPGAPTQLPAADRLVQSGWTACTASGAGVRVVLPAESEGAAQSSSMATVRAGGRFYLLATTATGDGTPSTTRAYPLTDSRTADQVLATLDAAPTTTAIRVDAAFLDLFERGPALAVESFRVGPRAPVGYGDRMGLRNARAGDLVSYNGDAYLLTAEGPSRLDPFAAQVYAGLTGSAPALAAGLDRLTEPTHPAEWPSEVGTPIEGPLCARLSTAGTTSRTALIADPDPGSTGSADPNGPGAQVPAGSRESLVDPGRGAVVRTGTGAGAGGEDETDGADGGAVFLIDSQGLRHRLVDDAPALLGYDAAQAPRVPNAWLELFGCGVELSQRAAVAGTGGPTGTAGTDPGAAQPGACS